MKQNLPRRRILCLLTVLLTGVACVDNAYDLSDISLKMSVGTDGLIIPLGKIDTLTVDSLVRRAKVEDLVLEDGYYAYRRDSVFHETIDAILIDPIRDIVPALDPYMLRLTEGALPETFRAEGFEGIVSLDLPSFAFGREPIPSVRITKTLPVDAFLHITPPAGSSMTPSPAEGTEQLEFSFADIPHEVASIDWLFFGGTPSGSPVQVRFSLECLTPAVQSGKLDLTLSFPDAYTLSLNNDYGGTASISGSTLVIRNYPVTQSQVSFLCYLQTRRIEGPIPASRVLSFSDQIHYSMKYTGVSNGTPVPSGEAPWLDISLTPEVSDMSLRTEDIRPAPTQTSTDIAFTVEGLEGISEAHYIAFTDAASNALVLHTGTPQIPLQGEIPVTITFPAMIDFASGIEGLEGQRLTTTLDRLAAGMTLPLRGIRLEGDDARVQNGQLSVQKPVVTTASPFFPGASYLLSALASDRVSNTFAVNADDMMLYIDPAQSEFSAGFSDPIDIRQPISQSFRVPDEVGNISFATVANATDGTEAALVVSFDIEDAPVDACYFDDIAITLPSFLEAEHPGLDPDTQTVYIDRVAYRGRRVEIARITIKGIRDLPVHATKEDKLAALEGEIRLRATATLPEGSHIHGLDHTDLVLLPAAELSPLQVTHIRGSVELDLAAYLKPTTIDLSDLQESLGKENIELNLVAPRISLHVNNPLDIAMTGDITLQPYDLRNQKLDPVVIRNVRIEAAGQQPLVTTHLYVTDGDTAPQGYTLCRVEDLSKLVKTVPSRLDISFGLAVDTSHEQSVSLTGEDYQFDIDYTLLVPLQFQENAMIDYSDMANVTTTFEDLDSYEVTAEDILLTAVARSTIPIDLDVHIQPLDKNKRLITNVTATVLERIKGYNPADGADTETPLRIRLDIEDGNIQRLKPIHYLKYTINGQAVGSEAGLAPEQYVLVDLQLVLKKGVTFDLESF